MVTHYDAYYTDDPKEEYDELAQCGARLSEDSGLTPIWDMVTCKRCLKQKDRLNRQHEETEAIIVKQMGDWVDYYNSITL